MADHPVKIQIEIVNYDYRSFGNRGTSPMNAGRPPRQIETLPGICPAPKLVGDRISII